MSYEIVLPKYVQPKVLESGKTGFYWVLPTVYKKAGCPWRSCTLGENLSQNELDIAAEACMVRLNEWRENRNRQAPEVRSLEEGHFRFGTVGWLLDYYVTSDAFIERVAEPSRADYLQIFKRVSMLRSLTSGVRYGDVHVREFAVLTAIAVYHLFSDTGKLRTAEKVIIYCETAWARMQPLFPHLFRRDVPNPWSGVTKKRREKKTKGHVGRKPVYQFAWGAVEKGRPELAAAAVLAFEFLMRPSSISAGYAEWSNYRSPAAPDKFKVRHRKNGGEVDHPLEAKILFNDKWKTVRFYDEAEQVFARVPRRSPSIVSKRNGALYGDGTLLSQEVREMADQLGMPEFTIDKARHGGMTELEESELTEGQGKALSTHRSSAYRLYAKETEKRVLTATKRRFGISENEESPSESKPKKPRK
ncbi:hypothetical protein EB232_19375 [Mesorhizobium sp. NZP2077]|nr:hypothetical protein EB232_19375 [Mesorhizobium sp. NZP2077]